MAESNNEYRAENRHGRHE